MWYISTKNHILPIPSVASFYEGDNPEGKSLPFPDSGNQRWMNQTDLLRENLKKRQ